MTNKYNDIIRFPHHQSSTHPHMSHINRAAQFAPFAALTGHKEAISEAERLTIPEMLLDEDLKTELDYAMRRVTPGSFICIMYFKPDQHKVGGTYLKKSGRIRRIDPYRNVIQFLDKEEVEIRYIIDLQVI